MPKRLIPFKKKFAKLVATGALLTSLVAAPVQANPSGASVQSGQVNITGGAGSMSIQQFSDRAIIDWQRFGIGAGESVQFLQPGQLSVILNRVVGQDPTQILGQMSANGNVWIINPNGVLFGPQSQVNVGGLLASTLNISNEDFLNGNYRFTQDQNKALASVVNQGSITITDGGYAILMAPLVSNEGMIVANLGQVNLMSGESATLNFDGRNLISYDIGHLDSAEPGTVVVDRSTVSALLANVIQDPNLTEAGGLVENADGSVSLVGAADTVLNSGVIQANGTYGQKAGKVVLDSGRLTVLGEGSSIEASGKGANSDGGEILALSHGTLKFDDGAGLEAKGGEVSGDGGFIETSGYEHLLLNGHGDASAVEGEAGTWVIDPDFLTIIDGGGGNLDGTLDTSTSANTIDTISETYLESLTGGTNIILQANDTITINDLTDNLLNFQDDVSVTFLTNTGDIIFASGDDTVSVGGAGDLTFDAGRDIHLGTVVHTGSGTINLAYDGVLIDQNGGATNLFGDNLSFDATQSNLQFNDGRHLEIAGSSNLDPLRIDLNIGSGREVRLTSDSSKSLEFIGGTLSSGNFQSGTGTDLNVVAEGTVNVNGLRGKDVSITAVGGDIVQSSGALTGDSLNLVATGGSIGTSSSSVSVSTSELSVQGDDGVFISATQDLENLRLISDAGGEASIIAPNGSLALDSNELAANLFDQFAGEAPGDSDGDGYDLTLDVTITGGDLTLGDLSIDGATDATNDGVEGRALLSIVNQGGNIEGDSGSMLVLRDDTDLVLRSETGSLGATTPIRIQTESDSPGELALDAVDEIRVEGVGGDFDSVSIAHDDGTVEVSFLGFTIQSVSGLFEGGANVSTIDYQNRTGSIGISSLTSNGSDFTLTAAGDILGTMDGVDDIVAGSNIVTVNAGGDFSADASSTTGSLEIGNVGGDVSLSNSGLLFLNAAGAGQVQGDLTIDNDGSLGLGGDNYVALTVLGDISINNALYFEDLSNGQPGLVADRLTVTADGPDTAFLLTSRVSDTITLNDLQDDGAGDADFFVVLNDGAFNTLNLNSDSSDDFGVSTDGYDVLQAVSLSDGTLFASDPLIANININEGFENVGGVGSFPESSNVTIQATGGSMTFNPGMSVSGNLTLFAELDIVLPNFSVDDTLDITSNSGSVTFFAASDGPSDLLVNTVGGLDVSGSWDSGRSLLQYDGSTDRLLLTDTGAADTNVTFQTDTDSIDVDFAGVGDCQAGDLNSLTLIATNGAISDENDPGTNSGSDLATQNGAPADPNLDLQGHTITLVAKNDIGGAPSGDGVGGGGALEVDACDTLSATSTQGSVSTSSTGELDHVIIDVDQQDFNVTFSEYVTGNTVNITYDGAGTGSLSENTNSGSFQGTNLTLIERGNRDVQVTSVLDNTGGGDPGSDEEFISLTSGGGLTVDGGSTIISQNIDLDAENGVLDIQADLTAENDIFLEASGDVSLAATVTAGDEVGVLSEGGDILGVGGLVEADKLALSAAGDIGVDGAGNASALNFTASELAADSGGDINLHGSGAGALFIGNNLALGDGTLLSGITGGGSLDLISDSALIIDAVIDMTDEICVDVVDGSLDILADVQANNDIFLEASGDVILGASVIGGTNASDNVGITSEQGTIFNAGGSIESRILGLSAGGDIGVDSLGAAAPLELDVRFFALKSGGDTYLNLKNVLYGTSAVPPSSQPLKTGSVAGITGDGDLSLTTAGDLDISGSVSVAGAIDLDVGQDFSLGPGDLESTGGNDIAVRAGKDITLIDGKIVSDGGTISLEAGDTVQDVFSTEASIDAGDGLVILKGQSVGVLGSSNSLELSASQLAANATNGVVYVNALDSDLEIVDATTLIGGVSVTGVSASDEICIDVEDGALDIGSIIQANNSILLEADGDVILGASVIGGTSRPNVGITSVNGDIVDAGGNINVEYLALSAGNDIGVDSTGAASPIDFDADSLAASAGGDINLNKVGGGNLVVFDHPVKSGTIIGITGGGDLDLVTDGDLNVSRAISMTGAINLDLGDDLFLYASIESTGGGDIAIRTQDDVIVNTSPDDAIFSNDGTISIDAGDDIQVRNGNNLDLDAGNGLIVIRSGGEIDGLEIAASQLAVSAAEGDVTINDIDSTDLEIVEATTILGGVVVTGVSGSEDVTIEVEDGSLNVGETVQSGQNISLTASEDVSVGASVTGGTDSTDYVDISAENGDLINSGGTINASNLSLSADGDIGVDSTGAPSRLKFSATKLAARAGDDINLTTTNQASVNSVNGLTGIQGGGDLDLQSEDQLTVDRAIRMTGDVSLDLDGRLIVNDDIESTGGGDIAIRAIDDVLLGSGTDDTIITNGGTISIETNGMLDDRNGAGLDLNSDGGTILLDARFGVGNSSAGEDIEISASELAARSTGGQVYIRDIDSDNLEIVRANTLLGGTNLNGVVGSNVVCIDVEAGSLDIQRRVQAGNIVYLEANGDVTVGANITVTSSPGGEAGITSENGDIVDAGGKVTAPSLALSADGDIGVDSSGSASPLSLGVSDLAADAGGDINLENDRDLTVEDSLRLKSGTVDGVTAGGDINLATDGELTVTTNLEADGDICLDVDELDLRAGIESTGGNDIAVRSVGDILLGNGADRTLVSNGGTISLEAGGNIVNRNGDNLDLDADDGLVVLTGGRFVGSSVAGSALQISASQLAAASSMNGDVAVEAIGPSDLEIVEATTLKGGVVVTGVEADNNVSITVENGSLNIQEDILAGRDLTLEANGDVTVAARVKTGTDEAIHITAVNGDIINGGGRIEGHDLGLSAAGDIGVDSSGAASPIVVDVTALAAEAGNDINLQAVGGVRISDIFGIDGVQGGGDLDLTSDAGIVFIENAIRMTGNVCLDLNELRLSEDIESTGGGDIAIEADSDVLLGDGSGDAVLSNGGTISVETGGSLVDRNGDSMDLDSDGGLVVLGADGGIGGTAAGEEVEIGAARLAASAAGGDVAISDIDTGSLEIVEATTLKGGAVVTGVSASDDICLDVSDGRIGVGQVVQAGGDIFLEAENIFINADILGGTDSTDQVGITARTGDISQTENGDIRGYSVALSAGGDIGVDGGFGDSVLGIDATNVAAEAGGFIHIEKLGGQDLAVAENLSLKSGTVSGLTAGEELELSTDEALTVEARVQAADDICLDIGGTLTLSEVVESTGGSDIAIQTGGDVLLGDGANDAVLSNGGTISIEAAGSVVDRNGANMDLDSDGGLVVLDAAGGIGGTGAGEEIEIGAAQLAASAADRSVVISDIDSGGLEIAEATTLKNSIDVAGVSASEDVRIDVVDGTLSVNADITAGQDVALRTQDRDLSGDGDILLDSTVTATGGRISLQVDDNLVDNTDQSDNAAALVTQDTLVIASGGPIGPLQVEAAGLAASSSEGDIDIIDLSGDLRVTQETTILGAVDVDGLNASGDVCLDVLDGDLDLAQQVKGEEVALRADGSVTLSGSADVSANRQTGTVSVEAGTQIENSGSGIFAGRDVVLRGGSGVGPVSVEADNLAADGGTGGAEVRDIAGGLRISELQTLKGGGDIVTGLTASQDVSLEVVGGDLVIDEVVSSGTVTAVQADGSIASNATVAGTDKVSVEAGGDIIDGLDGEGPGNENFQGSDVVIRAGGNLGSSTEHLDIDSDRLAATGNNVYLDEVRGDMNIAELNREKGGGAVAGVIATEEVALTADDGTIDTSLRIQAEKQITLQTRDTLVIESPLATNPDGKISIEVTQGGIESQNAGTDIETGAAVLKASESIGSTENPVRTSVDMLAVESTNGSVNIVESNGLKIKPGVLSNGSTVEGGRAGQDFNLKVENGDLELANITAGNDVNLTVSNGDVIDCNGEESNVDAGRNVDISAPNGYVGVNQDALEINAGGKVTIVQRDMGRDDADPITLPPGVFAQDNVKLGESSFYLDVLYGWQPIDEVILIIEELDTYE